MLPVVEEEEEEEEEDEEEERWSESARREGKLEGKLEAEIEGERKIFRMLLEAQLGALPDWVIARLGCATEQELLGWGMKLINPSVTLEELLSPPAIAQDNPAPEAPEGTDAP